MEKYILYNKLVPLQPDKIAAVIASLHFVLLISQRPFQFSFNSKMLAIRCNIIKVPPPSFLAAVKSFAVKAP